MRLAVLLLCIKSFVDIILFLVSSQGEGVIDGLHICVENKLHSVLTFLPSL